MVKRFDLKQVGDYQTQQCKLFAEYSTESSLEMYKDRNQLDEHKIFKDIFTGKLAEYMVYNYFIERNVNVSTPDLNIYNSNRKSYDADIRVDDIGIHVKSHEVNEIYPISWVFQKNDPLVLHRDDSTYLCLVVFNGAENYMYIVQVKEVDFKEPIKEKLRETKVCLYERDIEGHE